MLIFLLQSINSFSMITFIYAVSAYIKRSISHARHPFIPKYMLRTTNYTGSRFDKVPVY